MSADVLELPKKRPNKFERVEGVEFLRFHVDTQFYYVRKFFTREKIPPLFKTTKQKKKLKAKTEAERMIQQWRNYHLGIEDRSAYQTALVRGIGKKVSLICDEILEKYTPTQRPQTRKQHKLYFKFINQRFGDEGVNQLSVDKFDDWIEVLRKTPNTRTGKPRKTYKNFAKHMNLMCRWAYERKYATHRLSFPDPDKRIRRELEEKSLKALSPIEKEILELKSSRCYTTAEIRAIWPHLNESWRLRLILSLECFMRFMEAGKLEWDRVNLDTGLITLRPQDVKTGSRTGKGRQFYVSKRALVLLRERRSAMKVDSPYVFPNRRDAHRPASHAQVAWREAKELAGIKGQARWHDLRHTALSFALLGDLSLTEDERKAMRQEPLLVSEYAGVSMAVIQRVYLHTQAEHTKKVTNAFDVLDLDTRCDFSVNSGSDEDKTV